MIMLLVFHFAFVCLTCVYSTCQKHARCYSSLLQMHGVLALDRICEVDTRHVQLLRANVQKLRKRHLQHNNMTFTSTMTSESHKNDNDISIIAQATHTSLICAHAEESSVCDREIAVSGIIRRVQILHCDRALLSVAVEVEAQSGARGRVVGGIGRINPLDVEERRKRIQISVVALKMCEMNMVIEQQNNFVMMSAACKPHRKWWLSCCR